MQPTTPNTNMAANILEQGRGVLIANPAPSISDLTHRLLACVTKALKTPLDIRSLEDNDNDDEL
jgi:hypothetical protein